MGFQDVALLPSRASFYTTFLKHCGRGLGTATCLKTVVGVAVGMLPVKCFRSNISSYCVSLFFNNHKTVTALW